jgi:hypothetical protein
MRPEYRYVSNLTFEFTHMGRAPKGGAHGAGHDVPWIASVDVKHVVADLDTDGGVAANHVRQRGRFEI